MQRWKVLPFSVKSKVKILRLVNSQWITAVISRGHALLETINAHWAKIISVGVNCAAHRPMLVMALSCDGDMLIDDNISNNVSRQSADLKRSKVFKCNTIRQSWSMLSKKTQ